MNRVVAGLVATLAALVVLLVGGIAAVASYWHARAFAAHHAPVTVPGAPDMSPWLPLTTDGMVIAALLVIWTRRLTLQAVHRGPYAVLGLGLVATVGANYASAGNGVGGILVAVWAPITFAVCDICVALLAAPLRAAFTTEQARAVAPPVEASPAIPATMLEPVTFDDDTDTPSWAVHDPEGRIAAQVVTADEIAARSTDVRDEIARLADTAERMAAAAVPAARADHVVSVPAEPDRPDDTGPWTDDDERIRVELQADLDADRQTKIPSARFVRNTYRVRADRANRIVARLQMPDRKPVHAGTETDR